MSPVMLHLCTFIFFVSHIGGEVIRCAGGDCVCDTNRKGEACVLDCGTDDICKGQNLMCRPNDICYIQCSAKSSCSAGTTIYGNGATDVRVACIAQDACIDSGHIYCGSGDCSLSCTDSTSCIQMGIVHTTVTLNAKTTNARSFGCDGFCPFNLPKSYSESPTPSPSFTPTNAPTFRPSTPPSKAPSNNPTVNTMAPSNSPSTPPSNIPTQSPAVPTFPPTSFPSYFPSIQPTSNPVPFGYEYGAFDQLCKKSEAGLAPMIKACAVNTASIGDYHGELQCMQPYECCLCKSVQCGYKAGMPCDVLRVGEFGVYGVGNIKVTGSKAMRASGASIECVGKNACAQSEIYGQYVEGIACEGIESCQNAMIVVDQPKRDFGLECTGKRSCNGLTLEINLEGPPVGFRCNPKSVVNTITFGQIVCAQDGCDGLRVVVNNEGCDRVLIESIACSHANACDFAQFELIGNVAIGSCQNLNLKECFYGLPMYQCRDGIFCSHKNMIFSNPLNGFLFECTAVGSCSNSEFLFEIESNAVSYFQGFRMNAVNAAQNATFVIDNRQSGALRINRLECLALGSCEDMTLIIGTNVLIEQVVCATDGCLGCVIKQSVNDLIGTPCDPQQAAQNVI